MKFENNNKEIIKKITKRSLKTNKVRNIFAILAIVLTTFMISSVFSIGLSPNVSDIRETARAAELSGHPDTTWYIIKRTIVVH